MSLSQLVQIKFFEPIALKTFQVKKITQVIFCFIKNFSSFKSYISCECSFPHRGLPANTIKSDLFNPPKNLFKPEKPVSTPVRPVPRLYASSINFVAD